MAASWLRRAIVGALVLSWLALVPVAAKFRTGIAEVMAVSAGSSGGSGVTAGPGDSTGATLCVAKVTYLSSAGGTMSDSVSATSNTWTALTAYNETTQGSRFYYAENPTVGSGHTFTYAGSSNFPALLVKCFSGTALASVYDTPHENGMAAASTTYSIQPGSVTPSQDNSLVITGLGVNYSNSGGTTINGGFSTPDEVAYSPGNSFAGDLSYLVQTSAAAANPTWSVAGPGVGVGESANIAVFKPSAGGPTFPAAIINTPIPCCGFDWWMQELKGLRAPHSR